MARESTRPRGILTQADREYLRGERELTRQSERNRRRRIRNRIFHAIQDFSLLWSNLDDDDLELVFNSDDEDEKVTIRSSMQDMLAFGVLGLIQNDDYYPRRFEEAIRQAEFGRNRRTDVTVEVETELMPSPDVILDRLQDSGFQNTRYTEFERALKDPNADPEKIAALWETIAGMEIMSEEGARLRQEMLEERAEVRESLPTVINVEPDDPEV